MLISLVTSAAVSFIVDCGIKKILVLLMSGKAQEQMEADLNSHKVPSPYMLPDSVAQENCCDARVRKALSTYNKSPLRK